MCEKLLVLAWPAWPLSVGFSTIMSPQTRASLAMTGQEHSRAAHSQGLWPSLSFQGLASPCAVSSNGCPCPRPHEWHSRPGCHSMGQVQDSRTAVRTCHWHGPQEWLSFYSKPFSGPMPKTMSSIPFPALRATVLAMLCFLKYRPVLSGKGIPLSGQGQGKQVWHSERNMPDLSFPVSCP